MSYNFVPGINIATITPGDDFQGALDSLAALGGGTINLIFGTYNLTSDINIPSNVLINGNGAILDFGGGAYQFGVQGSNPYSTGTISAVFASPNVVGVGSSWDSSMEGQSILIGEYWYTILTVTDATNLILSSNFLGTNLTGDIYVIATLVTSVKVKDLTVQNSSVSLVRARYSNIITFDGVTAIGGDKGFDIQDSSNVFILNYTADTCITAGLYVNNAPFMVMDDGLTVNGGGMQITRTSNTAMSIFSLQGITGVGISFTDCHDIGLVNYAFVEIASHGVEFVSGNRDIQITIGQVQNAGGDGIRFTSTTDRCYVTVCSMLNSGGYGINIVDPTCDNNTILGVNFDSNLSGAVSNSGTGTLIRSNIGVSDN